MAITDISRNNGVGPSVVSITTTDDLTTITTAGYLNDQATNIEALNNGAFEWLDGDFVAIDYDGGEDWFSRDAANATFVANTVPGSLSNSLPSSQIFVGNASNIASGVALSGDATVDNAGAITIANEAVTYPKIQQVSATDKILGRSTAGAGVIEEIDCTPFARSLLDDADAATARSTLGITSGGVSLQVATVGPALLSSIYATPLEVLPALSGGEYYVLVDAKLYLSCPNYGGSPLTNGGEVGLQFNNTANLAGEQCTDTISAATMIAAPASFDGFISMPINYQTVENLVQSGTQSGVYLSNDTAAFNQGINTWTVEVVVTYFIRQAVP